MTAPTTEPTVDWLAGVNPRTIGPCSWCRQTVRWVNTPSTTDRDGNHVPGTVLAVDPVPVPDGDVLIGGDGGTATLLTGTDVRTTALAWRAHHAACPNSPRVRAKAKTSSTTAADGRPRCTCCRKPLDPVLADLGETSHPCCDREDTAARHPRRRPAWPAA